MRMRTSLPVQWLPAILLAVGLTACSSETPRQAQIAAAKAMVPAGEPVRCVQIRNIRDTKVLDNQTIDFRMTGGKVYRNTLPYACPGLSDQDAFTYSTTQSQLCSIDVITVLHTAGTPYRGASCGLGQFVPVKAADPDAADDAASAAGSEAATPGS